MRNDVTVTALALWERAEKVHDSVQKINRQRQDRAELDHDRVHFPKTVMQIEMEERFGDAQMGGRTHRQRIRSDLRQSRAGSIIKSRS